MMARAAGPGLPHRVRSGRASRDAAQPARRGLNTRTTEPGRSGAPGRGPRREPPAFPPRRSLPPAPPPPGTTRPHPPARAYLAGPFPGPPHGTRPGSAPRRLLGSRRERKPSAAAAAPAPPPGSGSGSFSPGRAETALGARGSPAPAPGAPRTRPLPLPVGCHGATPHLAEAPAAANAWPAYACHWWPSCLGPPALPPHWKPHVRPAARPTVLTPHWLAELLVGERPGGGEEAAASVDAVQPGGLRQCLPAGPRYVPRGGAGGAPSPPPPRRRSPRGNSRVGTRGRKKGRCGRPGFLGGSRRCTAPARAGGRGSEARGACAGPAARHVRAAGGAALRRGPGRGSSRAWRSRSAAAAALPPPPGGPS